MPFYSTKGDQGSTDLLGGTRVRKDHPLIKILGLIDELNAWLGIAKSHTEEDLLIECLQSLQEDLFEIMGEISKVNDNQKPFDKKHDQRIDDLERFIAKFEKNITIPRRFMIPGDSVYGSYLNMLRVFTRRVEREIVHISEEFSHLDQSYTAYFNRLSSLFYLLWVREKDRKS